MLFFSLLLACNDNSLVVDGADSGSGSDPAGEDTAQAALDAMWDGARLVVESPVSGAFLPLDEDTLASLKVPSSYSGMSLVVEPLGIRARLVVPVEQIRGVTKLAEVLMRLQGGLGLGANVIQEVQ